MRDRPMDAAKLRAMEHSGREIAKALERAFARYGEDHSDKWGFALMIFSFDGPEFTWISNAQRADMVKAMQEFISRNPPNQTSADRS
jgi:FPC/CPF motif-containing protein YcgG